MTAQDRLVATLAATLLLAGSAALLGLHRLLGPFVFSSLALTLALGYGRRAARARIALALAAYGAVFCCLILLLDALHDPVAAEPPLVAGLPAATAVLVYLIWPLGAAAGLLYALVFDRDVLPSDRLRTLRETLSRLQR